MYGADAVMEPSCFRAVDKVGDYVEGVRVGKFCVYDIGDCFVVEVNLSYPLLAMAVSLNDGVDNELYHHRS